jgi:hypothetical protein
VKLFPEASGALVIIFYYGMQRSPILIPVLACGTPQQACDYLREKFPLQPGKGLGFAKALRRYALPEILALEWSEAWDRMGSPASSDAAVQAQVAEPAEPSREEAMAVGTGTVNTDALGDDVDVAVTEHEVG